MTASFNERGTEGADLEPGLNTGIGEPQHGEDWFVVLGTARLPERACTERGEVLMIELSLDAPDGSIVNVATTIPMPGYNNLLRRLLAGLRLSQVETVAARLCDHYRGPLLKPTIAALTNAAGQTFVLN